jgi:xanthine dehydrogenase YagS FAD-binding subunit
VTPFVYTRAESIDDALAAIARSTGGRFIAGGTNLLDLMKDGVEQPSLLIDINALPLARVYRDGDRLHIGSLARMSDVAADIQVRAAFPGLATALEESASPQLRNMASIGGNVMQRTRCPYFRDLATPCNKRVAGSGCGAIGGVNRNQAVLGTSEHCIAAHASDLAVALMAFDAVVRVEGRNGGRDVALSDFYRMPAAEPGLETALAAGEIITSISLPLTPGWPRSAYVKVRDRAQFEFALASAAVALDVEAGSVVRARIALGGVGTIPWRSPAAEALLAGQPATRAAFARAAEAALQGARGYGQNDFKIPLAKRTLVRALEIAAAAA